MTKRIQAVAPPGARKQDECSAENQQRHQHDQTMTQQPAATSELVEQLILAQSICRNTRQHHAGDMTLLFRGLIIREHRARLLDKLRVPRIFLPISHPLFHGMQRAVVEREMRAQRQQEHQVGDQEQPEYPGGTFQGQASQES